MYLFIINKMVVKLNYLMICIDDSSDCCKCNFPLNSHLRMIYYWMVGWLVYPLVGRSVIIS